jgi:TetR/AcrR family transcriptional repressor of cmeABC operon
MANTPPKIRDPEPATERGRYRRDRILDAATEVLIEQGYARASVAEIGRRAGGSLQTLYRQFGSKEGLVRAVIERKCRTVYGPLEPVDVLEKEPEQALYELGVRLAQLALTSEALMLHRIVLAEGYCNPALRRMFYEEGPGRAQALLAQYFRRQLEQGRLRLDDCEVAAMQFLDMVKGSYAMPALLGQGPSPDEPAIEAGVRQAVGIFLEGARAR